MSLEEIQAYGSTSLYFIILLVLSAFLDHPLHLLPGLRRRRHAVGNRTPSRGTVVPVTGIVIVRQGERISLRLHPGVQLTPPVRAISTRRNALSERQRALVEDKVNVRRGLAALVAAPSAAAVGGDGRRGLDELDVEAAAEGHHVGDDELAVRLVAGGGEQRGELPEAEGCEGREEVDFVSEVEVEVLVGGEGRVHAVERHCCSFESV